MQWFGRLRTSTVSSFASPHRGAVSVPSARLIVTGRADGAARAGPGSTHSRDSVKKSRLPGLARGRHRQSDRRWRHHLGKRISSAPNRAPACRPYHVGLTCWMWNRRRTSISAHATRSASKTSATGTSSRSRAGAVGTWAWSIRLPCGAGFPPTPALSILSADMPARPAATGLGTRGG